MTERAWVVVMAKAPRLGHGKQRLAAGLGDVAALRINRALQARALRAALGPWRTVLRIAPDRAISLRLPGIWPDGAARMPQGAGDLGGRIARAIGGLKGPVVVIGTDAPELSRARIASALQALHWAQSAIGPARDGGFWLVAARRAETIAAALPGVRWSSPHACADICAGLARPIARLPLLWDIDEAADWRAFEAQRAARRRSSAT